MAASGEQDVLEAGLAEIALSPARAGAVELIVRRPREGEREVLDEARIDVELGLVGDSWLERERRRARDGVLDRAAQLTLMNARVAALLAGERARWPLAGDQIYADLDLGSENLPAGTRLRVGSALVEVSELPHTGCAKFRDRFGSDALRFVNSPLGRALRLRGLNARVLESGLVRHGDAIVRL